jgi:hypothetical protein
MDAPMKKGTPVKQVIVPFEGVVTAVDFDQEAMKFKYRVSYKSGDDTHDRWFYSDEVAEVKKAEEKAEEAKP